MSLTHKLTKIISVLLSITITVGLLLYWLKGHSAPQLIGEAIFKVDTFEKVVALTFDDGPSLKFTPKILDVLKKYNVKATFFLLGCNAQKHPDLVRRIYQEGHEIGNHSWSHERLVFKWPSYVRQEIESTDQLIKSLGYAGPINFRAPYGNKLIILPLILKEMGRPHILFDIIPKDWEFPTPQVISQKILEDLHPGAIILLHDAGGDMVNADMSSTVQALDLVIPAIKQQGYEFLKIEELLEKQSS